jgi:hypothetical protein
MFPNLLYTSSQVSTISKLVLTTPLRFTSNYEDQEPFSHAKSFFKELKTRWWSIYIYTCLFFSYLFIWGGTCKSWQESGGLAWGIMIRCLWVRVKGQRLRSFCHKVWSEECGCAYKIAICHNHGCLHWNALWTWLILRRCKKISAPHDQHCNLFFFWTLVLRFLLKITCGL